MFIYTSMEALINSESLYQTVYIAGSLASESVPCDVRFRVIRSSKSNEDETGEREKK